MMFALQEQHFPSVPSRSWQKDQSTYSPQQSQKRSATIRDLIPDGSGEGNLPGLLPTQYTDQEQPSETRTHNPHPLRPRPRWSPPTSSCQPYLQEPSGG